MRIAFPSAERRLRRALAGLVLGAVAGACYTGAAPERHAPALTPRGHTVTLRLARTAAARAGGNRLGGELLAVTDTALLVLQEPRMLLVPWRAIESVEVPRTEYVLFGRRTPPGDALQQWRLLSRYPQGVSAPLLARLLAASRQDSLAVVDQ
jgi:hypothetical protein